MKMLNSLKPPENNFSVNGPRDHILLGYDDAKLFETPVINNHSVTEPSDHICLVTMTLSPLNNPINKS